MLQVLLLWHCRYTLHQIMISFTELTGKEDSQSDSNQERCGTKSNTVQVFYGKKERKNIPLQTHLAEVSYFNPNKHKPKNDRFKIKWFWFLTHFYERELFKSQIYSM